MKDFKDSDYILQAVYIYRIIWKILSGFFAKKRFQIDSNKPF